MGADQSSATSVPLRSQRDEDLPYTSFTISKPIDGAFTHSDTPRSSPRLASKTKGHGQKDGKEGGTGKHDIVVVKEGAQPQQVDSELQKLESIPVFLPIMRGSLNVLTVPNLNLQVQLLHDPEVLEKLDYKNVVLLCSRYQDHLKQCAEAVAFDQNALCVRIKEIDYSVHLIYSKMTEAQKKFAKYAEQIQKINEMHSVLNRVKMNVDQTVSLMERLNSVLPPSEQLEPFSMKPQKPPEPPPLQS